METSKRYRDVARRHLRDAIVDAARELTIAHGWDNVRMAEVAAVVGISRQTVYNEFASKAGLAEALARREVERFVADVRACLFTHGDDVRAGAYAAILRVLREAAGNPLIKAILTSAREADPLLPFLTTRAEIVLIAATAVVQDWARAHAPEISDDDLRFGAESIVRLVVSHIVLPTAAVEHTAERLADFATLLVTTYSATPARR
ncbi:TetR family transcriptional regulator [Micromonospora sp. KC213]|uniref:TetR/AcrR family transcriptional regulator n=1 Tax=Micromonospora sp. KC213 TaxID=2530378 RepID=UPI00104719CD|nr:TetR family transcriptional regulator [Micromonospora sp. KC213]TDC36536.1 TetR/AcrR family transcriptional regulator [Micromonospora sp. KC213]